MPSKRKQEVITFKVDETLRQAMAGIANRSEFIRAAILLAINNICPLCKGAGVLTPDQRIHWEGFAQHHPLRQCAECHAVHLVCKLAARGKEKSNR